MGIHFLRKKQRNNFAFKNKNLPLHRIQGNILYFIEKDILIFRGVAQSG